MKNKLILHIGMPKTGTTCIQKFLTDNVELLNKFGYDYPSFNNESYFSDMDYKFDISSYFSAGKLDTNSFKWKKMWEILKEKLNNNNVIISDETIFIRDFKQIISKIKKEYENLYVLVYLRRQDLFLESMYNQLIKRSKYKADIDEYLSLKKFDVKYLKLLDEISDIIGKNNLIVRIYEKEQFYGNKGDVVLDFLETLKIPIDSSYLKVTHNKNGSIYGNFLELKRVMNSILEYDDIIGEEIYHILCNSLDMDKRCGDIRNSEGFLSDEQRNHILNYYADENRKIAKKYLGTDNGILFYNRDKINSLKIDYKKIISDTKYICYVLLEKLSKKLNMIEKHIDDCRLKLSNIENRNNMYDLYKQELNYISEVKYSLDVDFNNLEQRKLDCEDDIKNSCFSLCKTYTLIFVFENNKINELDGIINAINIIDNKSLKIVLFGLGSYCENMLKNIKLDVEFIIDNNSRTETRKFDGIDVKHPSDIQDWNNIFVIITAYSTKAINEIEIQLNSYGLKKYKNYILAKNMFNEYVL